MKHVRLFLLVLLLGTSGWIACDHDSSSETSYCQWVDSHGEVKHGLCQAKQACCDKGCTLVSIDTQNCGDCGIVCEDSEICRHGRCVDRLNPQPGVEDDAIICDGVEVIPSAIGMLDCTRCMSGRADCNDDLSDGCEVDLQSLNMSDCYNCRRHYGNCNNDLSDGCEVALLYSDAHCSACGAACQDGKTCYRGTCVANCPNADEDLCQEGDILECRKLQSDVANCGYCGRLCEFFDGASVTCWDGQCIYTCEAGENCSAPDLPPVCTELQSDPDHCGRCGKTCQNAQMRNLDSATCVDGNCIIQCQNGFGDCDGDPSNGCEQSLRFDAEHCGACNHHCKAPDLCIEGNCCQRRCDGKICGDDGCGGLCGECPSGYNCSEDGTRCEPMPENFGCSDGTREGYIDVEVYDKIAACGGAWDVPGIHHNEGPACARAAGNSGTNRLGTGCNVEDLCAEGWHVCLGKDDLKSRTALGCGGIMDGIDPSITAFFLTRTSSTGNHVCAPDTIGDPINANDIFGCGNMGYELALEGQNVIEKCDPLTRGSNNHCKDLDTSVWNCRSEDPSKDDGWHEADNVTKSNPDESGGVLCCKDQCNSDDHCPGSSVCAFHVCVECRNNTHCPDGKTCTAHVCK